MSEERMMPNDALRLLLLAIEEVMGAEGMKAVLHGAKLERYIGNYPPKNLDLGVKFSEYGGTEQAIEDFYGPRGARAMLQRVGRATFNYAMKEQSAILGLAGQALKMMPLPAVAKQKLLLDQMVSAQSKTVRMPTRLDEDAEAYYWIIDYCVCVPRPKHTAACCYVTLGGLVEAMKWLTEKTYAVQETECMNIGAPACRFRIPKTPTE